MLHSPVNRLGLGLVTLTGINALIFFLLHIITHAWGGEIGVSRHREDTAAAACSKLLAEDLPLLAAVSGWRGARRGQRPDLGTLMVCGRWGEEEGGLNRGGGLGSVFQPPLLCVQCLRCPPCHPRRKDGCCTADRALIASPAASPIGFWCWARFRVLEGLFVVPHP